MSDIFGRNLRAARERQGYTQKELSEMTGMARSTINMYEHGSRDPSFEVLCILASALCVPVQSLITEQQEEPQMSEEDEELLRLYHGADPVYRSVALEILRGHQLV